MCIFWAFDYILKRSSKRAIKGLIMIKLSKEQVKAIDRIYNHNLEPHERLNFINIRLKMLIECINLVNSNANQSPLLKKITQNTIPSVLLHEYLVQELVSFYKNGTVLTNDPSIRPEYYPELERFRDSIPAHMDHKQKLKDGKDWLNQYNIVFGKIGLNTLLTDFANSIPKYEQKLGKPLLR